MSEPTPAPAQGAEPAADQTPTETAPKPTETVDFWKQKAREQEQRAKSNADAAKRLAEIEESQKSEAQKLSDVAAKATADAAAARAETTRYKAAAAHGITPDYFDLLGTGDEETVTGRAALLGGLLRSHAEVDAMKKELEQFKAGGTVPSRPVESLRPGATPKEPVSDTGYPASWLPTRNS